MKKIKELIAETEKEIERLERLKEKTSQECWLPSAMRINLYRNYGKKIAYKEIQQIINEQVEFFKSRILTPNRKSKGFIEISDFEFWLNKTFGVKE